MGINFSGVFISAIVLFTGLEANRSLSVGVKSFQNHLGVINKNERKQLFWIIWPRAYAMVTEASVLDFWKFIRI